jgi:hypothetical protein
MRQTGWLFFTHSQVAKMWLTAGVDACVGGHDVRAGDRSVLRRPLPAAVVMSSVDVSRHDGVVAAVDAWFLGGPVDGRMMAVETAVDGSLPKVVRLSQTGMYVETADAAAPFIEHVYVLADRLDGVEVYQYRQARAEATGSTTSGSSPPCFVP